MQCIIGRNMDSMNGKRDLYLEANILLLLKKKKRGKSPWPMNAKTISIKLKKHVNTVLAGLNSLYDDGMLFRVGARWGLLNRSRQGQPRGGNRQSAGKFGGEIPGEEAKSDIAPW